MNLIDAIKQHAATLAVSGDFQTVSAAVIAVGLRSPRRACGGVETADALDAVGNRRRAIMTAMRSDPDGQYVMEKLSKDGVEWAHPRTIALIDGLIAARIATAEDKAALIELSAPLLFAGLTAEECEAAWQAENARQSYEALRNRRQAWNTLASNIRSQIESGQLADNAAVIAAVTTGLGA